MNKTVDCPVCVHGASAHFRRVDGHDYYACAACGSLHIAPDMLAMLDAGDALSRMRQASRPGRAGR